MLTLTALIIKTSKEIVRDINKAIRIFNSLEAVFKAKKKGKPTAKIDLPGLVALNGQFSNYFVEDLKKISTLI